MSVGTWVPNIIPTQAGNAGKVLSTDGSQLSWLSVGGTGTVTSVGLSIPTSIMNVTGTPVTASGTLTVTLKTQSANQLFAGPTTGVAAAPTFRALVAADIPNLDTSKLTTGTLGLARGGTGQTAFANQRIPFSNGTNLLSDPLFIYDTTNTRLNVGGAGTARINGIVSSGSTVAVQAYSQGTNNALQAANQSAYTCLLWNASNSNLTGASLGANFSRGTLAAPTQSLSGDQAFVLTAQGYTGTAFTPGFTNAISFILSENSTATSGGGEMVLSTTPNGSLTPVERVRIKNSGETVFQQAIATAQFTTTAKLALTPSPGWVVFDTTLNKLSYYNGSTWINL